MGDRELLSMRPILLATDAAAIRARRLLAAMIEAEARVHEPAPAAVA
jgi:vanillate O-demethylase monooxygenase subunit